jgi:hypothetical protein
MPEVAVVAPAVDAVAKILGAITDTSGMAGGKSPAGSTAPPAASTL